MINRLINQLAKPGTLILLLIVGLALRLINISDGLWLDEIWSMQSSAPGNSFEQIIAYCKRDTHPPLFDLLLNLFLKLFGDTHYHGRVLALIFGIAGIALTWYYAGKISENRLVKFAAAALVCLSFFHIYYSGEGRFYSFLYLLSLLCISELYLYISRKNLAHLVRFALGGILIIYTHYYGAILLFVLAIICFILLFLKSISWTELWRIALAKLIILIAFSPWLPIMLFGNSQESWMGKPGLGNFFEYLYLYSGKNPLECLFMLASLVGAIILFKKNKQFFAIMLGCIFLGFLVPFIISHVAVPMLHYRYTIIYYPAIILSAAMVIGTNPWLKEKMSFIVLSLVLLSSLVNFLWINPFIEEGRSEPWKSAAEKLYEFEAQEPIYCGVPSYLNYYLEKQGALQAQAPEGRKENSNFWYLKSPYLKEEPDFRSLEMKQHIDLKQGFVLMQFVAKEGN